MKLKNKLTREITYWLGIVVVGIVFGSVIQFTVAWTEPAAGVIPPNGNIGAPINTSPNFQIKSGQLGLNSNLLLGNGTGTTPSIVLTSTVGAQSYIQNINGTTYFSATDTNGANWRNNLMITSNGVVQISQNKTIQVGNAYLSSGGDYAHLSNNEWYNGSGWVTNGAAGALIQLAGQQINFYKHDAGGGHGSLGYLDSGGNFVVQGNVCAYNGGKCLSNMGGSTPACNWNGWGPRNRCNGSAYMPGGGGWCWEMATDLYCSNGQITDTMTCCVRATEAGPG